MYALLALSAVFTTWLIGDAFGVWDDNGNDSPEPPDEPQTLTGTPGTDDLLTGGALNDTLTGNIDDYDTLAGNAGDDLLRLSENNVGWGDDPLATDAGDRGTDTFQVHRGATVADFTPGEDRLEIVNFLDSSYEDNPDAYFWHSGGDGTSLFSIAESTGSTSLIATFPTLTAPPPLDDITEINIDDRLGQTTRIPGAQINFTQSVTGTDGADTLTLGDDYTIWDVATGDGDDVVTFDSLIVTADLGAGNDAYTSQDETTGTAIGPDFTESVFAGDGNDTITAGQLRASHFDGGAGDDLFNLIDYSDSGYAEALGGDGDDSFLLGMSVSVEGGAGADTFTVLNPHANIWISDFDPSEDVIAITVPPGYAGAGAITLRANADATTTVLLDDTSYARLDGLVSDTSGIVLVTDPAAVS